VESWQPSTALSHRLGWAAPPSPNVLAVQLLELGRLHAKVSSTPCDYMQSTHRPSSLWQPQLEDVSTTCSWIDAQVADKVMAEQLAGVADRLYAALAAAMAHPTAADVIKATLDSSAWVWCVQLYRRMVQLSSETVFQCGWQPVNCVDDVVMMMYW
jgi:hypothetical protein